MLCFGIHTIDTTNADISPSYQIHNWDKLQKRAQQDPDSQPSKDLAHLLGRVKTAEELEDYFKTREVNASARVTTFNTLWTIIAPKTLIVARPFLGIPQLLEVSGSPIPPRGYTKDVSRLWTVAWCWDWNGKNMVKVSYYFKTKRFRGTISRAWMNEPEQLLLPCFCLS